MHVHCPHCQNAIEIVEEGPFPEVSCPACGSSFSLVPDETQTLKGPEVQTVGHFELLNQIGIGHFGTVWEAKDLRLDRTVAVKIPRREQLSARDAEVFLREARTAAQLSHPGIVSIHEFGREDDTVYIVSDLVKGVTLSDRLTAQRPTCRDAAELCAKIGDALDHAHEAGVIHRDLKPSNIMLDAAGEPRIMDFGLAKREAGEITMTVDGKVLGTPAYMPPEQAKGEGHHADRRADVYSLGVILFELLTGERPFRGNTRMLLHQVIHEDAPSLCKLNSTIPRDLETICLKCLEKGSDRRYQTARELANDLRRYLRGEPITARPVSQTERLVRWCRREPLVAGLLAIVLAVSSVGLATTSWQWRVASREAFGAENARQSEAEAHKKTEETLTRTQERERIALRQLYSAHMLAATRAYENGNLLRVRTLLDHHRRDPTAAIRTLEWNFLWRMINPPHLFNLGDVRTMSLSPNGHLLAVSSKHSVSVWEVFSGEKIAAFDIESESIACLQFAPDGKGLLAGDSSGRVINWGLDTSSTLTTSQPFKNAVNIIAFNASGSQLAVADSQGAVKLVSPIDLTTRKSLPPFTHQVESLALSADGALVAVGQKAPSTFGKATVSVWNTESLERVDEFSVHVGSVRGVAFLDNNRLLSTCGEFDGTIKIRDFASKSFSKTLQQSQQGQLFGMVVFKEEESEVVASLSADGTVTFWDMTEVRQTRAFAAKGVSEFGISDKGEVLATLADGECTVWNMGSAAMDKSTTLEGHKRDVRSVSFSPDGTMLASGGFDDTIRLWDIAARRQIGVLDAGQEFVECVDFSPDGRRLVSSGYGNVKLWDLDVRESELILETEQSMHCAFSPDGKLIAIATGHWEKKEPADILLWDTQKKIVAKRLIGHRAAVESVEFSADGLLLVSASRDKTGRIWDVGSGQQVHQLDGHSNTVMSATFSTDRRVVATCGYDGTIRLWDAATGKERLKLRGHRNMVYDVAFASNDRTLVSAGWGGTVRFWDPDTGDERSLWEAHRPYVWDVAISHDNTILATGGGDKKIKLWSAPEPSD